MPNIGKLYTEHDFNLLYLVDIKEFKAQTLFRLRIMYVSEIRQWRSIRHEPTVWLWGFPPMEGGWLSRQTRCESCLYYFFGRQSKRGVITNPGIWDAFSCALQYSKNHLINICFVLLQCSGVSHSELPLFITHKMIFHNITMSNYIAFYIRIGP